MIKIKEKYNPSELYKNRWFKEKDIRLIKKAYQFASRAHEGQKRKSGEPYFSHPFATAKIVSQIGMGAPTIAAALLHDVYEDTKVTIKEIKQNFGTEISELVFGISELAKVRLKNPKLIDKKTTAISTSWEIENLRKMFAATAKDIRVMIIKLADRLHNLKTLWALPRNKQERIAKESLLIFGPIADRLSIGQLKGEIEDLAFKYAYPDKYKEVKKIRESKIKERGKILKKLMKEISGLLHFANIKHTLDGRVKHLYSLHKKIIKLEGNIDKIYDFLALRIIIPDESTAYKVLGILHQNYKPLPGLIKDYIARPKPNGYQSLHTTVFVKNFGIFEIQIRTQAMHEKAEYGVAAHFYYTEVTDPKIKARKFPLKTPEKKLRWVRELARWQEKVGDGEEFERGLKFDFFSDRIFVFTPMGDVKDLPEGATPIDFAYAVHTEVGNRMIQAKADGKMVKFNQSLKNGQVMEIITSEKAAGPKQDWLEYAKTSRAREKIRAALKKKGF